METYRTQVNAHLMKTSGGQVTWRKQHQRASNKNSNGKPGTWQNQPSKKKGSTTARRNPGEDREQLQALVLLDNEIDQENTTNKTHTKQVCDICFQRVGSTHEESTYHQHCLRCEECRSKAKEKHETGYDGRIKCQNASLSKAIRKSGGANFYDAERLMMEIIAAPSEQDAKKKIQEFIQLDEKKKPKNFKNNNPQEMKEFFLTARRQLREMFPNGQFKLDPNNRNGKDIFEITTKTWLEFKSGPEKTDANSGLKVLVWASGLEELPEILSPENRRRMDDPEKIKKSKRETMEKLEKEMKKVSKENQKKLFNYALAISYGFTQEEGIKSFVEHLEKHGSVKGLNIPRKMMFNYDGTLQDYTDYLIPGEDFNFEVVAGDEGRPFFRITGKQSGLSAIIYPNYKNSWTNSETGEKKPADCWVSSPCFHVWIKSLNLEDTPNARK